MSHSPPTLDMRPDGTFRAPPGPIVPMSYKIMLGAIAVAAIAGTLTVAALAIWVISMLLPVMLVAGVVAWAAMRFRGWRARGASGSAGSPGTWPRNTRP
jgi:uncharacterized membrane protein YhaH (DUF805 family)